MRRLAGAAWGAGSGVLGALCTGDVRQVLELVSVAWSTAARVDRAGLDGVRNLGLRTILGAMRATPIAEMEGTASVQPLEAGEEWRLLDQGEGMGRLLRHADILPPSRGLCQPLGHGG